MPHNNKRDRYATATHNSENRKLGLMAATYVTQGSCPSSCPLYHSGCYAEQGLVGIQTRRLNRNAPDGATPEQIAQAEAEAIDAMPIVRDNPLRLHVVGDCATEEAARIVSAAAERYMDRGGGPAYTYTHAWRDVPRDAWGRVSVLASCEHPGDRQLANERGYAAALIVDSLPSTGRFSYHGVQVLPCAYETRGTTCRDCGWCMRDQWLLGRELTIGFKPIGQRKQLVLNVVQGGA